MPVNDEPTPYEKEIRRAMNAIEKIADDTGTASVRLAAIARLDGFITRVRGNVADQTMREKRALTHADWHPGETDESLAEAMDRLQRRCP